MEAKEVKLSFSLPPPLSLLFRTGKSLVLHPLIGQGGGREEGGGGPPVSPTGEKKKERNPRTNKSCQIKKGKKGHTHTHTHTHKAFAR